jgi:hypothetical protein
VWVDEVLHVDATSGTCCAYYSEEATYASKGSLLPSTYLEWMAQSYGYISAAQHRLELINNQGDLKDAFLAAIKNFEILSLPSAIQEGDRFEIKMRATHSVGPVTLVDGKVEKNGKLMASASLKLFAIPKQR